MVMRHMPACLLFCLVTLAIAPAARAASGDVERLSDADREAAIEAGARAHQAAENAATAKHPARPFVHDVHGDVGVTVGTGGYQAVGGDVYGLLGDNGTFALALGETRFPAMRWGGWYPR